MSEHIPPNSLQAEEAVLGAILVDPKSITSIAPILKVADFYSHIHGEIAEVLYAMDAAGKPIDKISVAEELRARKIYDRVGGIAYLSRLMESGFEGAATPEYFAKLVAEKARLRRLIDVGKSIYRLGFEGEADVEATIADAERLLSGVADSVSDDGGMTAYDAALAIYRELDEAMSGQKTLGISSPFRRLDNHTGRFHFGEVIAVAGAPGQGKSTFAIQCAEHAAMHIAPSAVFALEMGTSDTVRRIIASRSAVDVRAMRRGDVTGLELERIGREAGHFSQLPMHFYDASRPRSVADIRRICRRLKDDGGLSLAVIDHPGFLHDVMTRGRNSKHEVLELCYMQLKALANELKITVMIVQHINRAGMDREPTLADLRDGGNLEGIAHMAIFPYRANLIDYPENGELIVAKNRDGKTGRIPVKFDGSRFMWREELALGGAA